MGLTSEEITIKIFGTRRQGMLFALVNLWGFGTYLAIELQLPPHLPTFLCVLSALLLIGDKATSIGGRNNE